MTEANNTTKPPKNLGDKIATLGAAMFIISVVLIFAGVSGAVLHNILQLGGIALVIVGLIMRKKLKK